jgi:hypothetical protein
MRPRFSPIACLSLGVACAGTLAGCNIVGPAYLLIHGPPKTPAAYTLDKERTAVVFVDDRANRMPRRALRTAMAAEAERVILGQKLVKDMITGQSAIQAAEADPEGQPVSIAEIGRSIGAQQVIYATIDTFTLSPDGQTFAPSMVVRVKVLDAADGKRLWPEDRRGATLPVQIPPKQGTAAASSIELTRAENELATAAGLALARLFFKHETPKSVSVPN